MAGGTEDMAVSGALSAHYQGSISWKPISLTHTWLHAKSHTYRGHTEGPHQVHEKGIYDTHRSPKM